METTTTQNRFAAFDQRELEILFAALDRFDPHGPDGLPQHAAKMDAVRASLVDEMQPVLRATNSSLDGSHFGEIYEDEFPQSNLLRFVRHDRHADTVTPIARAGAFHALGYDLFSRLCEGAVQSQNRSYAIEQGGCVFEAQMP
jgi:hypothetical protein